MGSACEVYCISCGYSKGLLVGIGMLYDRVSVLAMDGEGALLPSLVRSKKTIMQIRKLVNEKGAVLADGYGHAIYLCPKCRKVSGRFFIHLDYSGGSFEVDYKCSKCRVSMTPIDIEAANRDLGICPKCGKSELSLMSGIIMWD